MAMRSQAEYTSQHRNKKNRIYTGFHGVMWDCLDYAPEVSLFSNAKTGKYPPQQIIRSKLTSYFRQDLLRLAQVFGKQLACAVTLKLMICVFQALMGALQGVDVTAARHKTALSGAAVSHRFF